uniref:NADH dehydrogenase [ubiquinone] 1 beta subcomplex subunit 5, mitochondrial n=1 Tax=Schistocephalus solidus TaxID=70667 RepID=A0A0X3NNZ9_SCHSO
MLRAAGAFGRGPGVIGRLINGCGTFPGKNALNSALLSFRGRLWSLNVPTRNSSGGGGTLRIKQTAFHNEKLYDEMHFFVMLAIVPLGLLSFFTNIFIGQAELVETPEDYEPRYWEYYKHPITRFIARNLMFSPQQVYENYLAIRKRHMDARKLVIEDRWFQESELAKQDYRGWQFIPVNPAGVLRAHKDELLHEEMGHWFPR